MKKILYGMALLPLLASCSQDDEMVPVANPDEIRINASVGALTRMTAVDEYHSHFDVGDEIMVYGWSGRAIVPEQMPIASVNTLREGGVWSAEPQMLWQDRTSRHWFVGVYPVRTVTDFSDDVFVLDETRQEEADLLVAVSEAEGITADRRTVDLTFEHVMAKININLNFRNQFDDATPTPSEVKLYCGKDGKVAYLTKTVIAGKYDFNGSEYIAVPAKETPATGYDRSYSSIAVPQEGVNIVDVVIDGVAYRYEGIEDIPLEGGHITTLNLNVGKDEITLAGVTVGGWNEGTTLEGGEAEEVTHEYVDLGLPTGTLWATCNVGANAPEEVGDYFAWGETDPKTDYSWSTYKYCNGSSSTLTKYCYDNDYSEGDYTDNLVTLEASDDAATANWGSNWRMPTKTQMEELMTECTWTWTTDHNGTGVAGYIVSGKGEGNTNSIFLPAASYRIGTNAPNSIGSFGYYWCSSLNTGNYGNSAAWAIRIFSDFGGSNDMNFYDRYYGLSVRAVYIPAN